MGRATILVVFALLAPALLAGCARLQDSEAPEAAEAAGGVDVVVRQDPGKVVYWVLPGPRRLGEAVFGTPDNPVNTGEHQRSLAQGDVKELLEQAPILAGVPLGARETAGDNASFAGTSVATPVSDDGRVVTGQFRVAYHDRQPYDLPVSGSDTADAVEFNVSFTDPDGNNYTLTLDRLFQPDIPLWETGGGVVTNRLLHGVTGTDAPVFPTAYTYGAFWGVGDVYVNGELADEDKWVHFMTTQTVRNETYALATDEELPLPPRETIAGQAHHTHVIVRPVTVAPNGSMAFEPVNTSFTLPNGKRQPYIHVMFEQDVVVEGPHAGWNWSAGMEAGTEAEGEAPPESAPGRRVDVVGEDFSFAPSNLTVAAGETVTVVFRNGGTVAHNYGVEGLGARTETIQPGQVDAVTFTANETGTYRFWCSVAGHRHAGMAGSLNVTG